MENRYGKPGLQLLIQGGLCLMLVALQVMANPSISIASLRLCMAYNG